MDIMLYLTDEVLYNIYEKDKLEDKEEFEKVAKEYIEDGNTF